VQADAQRLTSNGTVLNILTPMYVLAPLQSSGAFMDALLRLYGVVYPAGVAGGFMLT